MVVIWSGISLVSWWIESIRQNKLPSFTKYVRRNNIDICYVQTIIISVHWLWSIPAIIFMVLVVIIKTLTFWRDIWCWQHCQGDRPLQRSALEHQRSKTWRWWLRWSWWGWWYNQNSKTTKKCLWREDSSDGSEVYN